MIDHYKLIDLLSDRLRIEIRTAGADLLEILEHLHRNLKDHGQAELPGLGTFSLHGDTISFEPDPLLVKEINFRYHGMQPIYLEPSVAADSDSEPDEAGVPETAVFVIDEPGQEQEQEQEQEQGLEPEQEQGQGRELVQMAVGGEASEPEPKPSPRGTGLKTPPLRWQDAHTAPIQIRIDNEYAHRGERWRRVIGITVIMLILFAGAGVSWYKGWLAGTGLPGFHEVFPDYATRYDPGSITLESPTIAENREAGVENREAGSGMQEQEQVAGSEVEAAVDPDPADAVTFGLEGPWQEGISGYHTIVSATMFTERVANEIFEEVTATNMRARLFRVRVQGEIAWELHLGQFDTRASAREANLTLDRKFQSDVVRQYGQQ